MGRGFGNGIERAARMAKEGQFEQSEETFFEYIDENPNLGSEDITAWVEYVRELLEQGDYERAAKFGFIFLEKLDVAGDQQPVTDRMYQLTADAVFEDRDQDMLITLLKTADQELPPDSVGRGSVLSRFAPRQVDAWNVEDPETAPPMANYGHRHAAVGNLKTAFIIWIGVTPETAGVPSIDIPITSSRIFAAALQDAGVAGIEDFDLNRSPQQELERFREHGPSEDYPADIKSVLQAALGNDPVESAATIRAKTSLSPEDIDLPVEGLQPVDQEAARRLAAAEVLERVQRA